MLNTILNEIPIELIAFLSGILVTILSGIGYVIKTWLENKSILKECLYNLLKAYKALRFIEYIDSGKFLNKLLEIVKEQIPNFEPSIEEEKQSKKMLGEILKMAFSPTRKSYQDSLATNYDSAINKLSQIKPIMAYKLDNQFHANKYIKDYGDAISSIPGFDESKEGKLVKQESQKHALKKAKKDLEKYILKVALRASKKSWFKLKFTSNIFKNNEQEMKEELSNFYSNIMEDLLEQMPQDIDISEFTNSKNFN